ncbi:MAG: sugar phosphate isomerase/epimerase [Verrucomicrobia bacterium]|nr:sugar phosphate isomerase/epimerase [Verrucomicrobiota bacterium]
MRFGASTFIWVSPFSNQTLGLVKKVRELGFDIIEICVEDPVTIDVGRIQRALAENDLTATVCGAFGPGRDASSDEENVRANTAKYLETCIDIAKELGSPFVAGPMYSATGKTNLLSPPQRSKQWSLAVETLKPVAEYAGERGVQLAIEPLNRFETDFINTVEQGLELIERIGASNVGLLLDTFHMNIEEKNLATAIRMAGSRVFHFHSCESDRGTPGTGHIEWPEVVLALTAINYQGPVVIEAFTAEITEIARAVSLWRPLAPDQDSLAREGLRFLQRIFNR